MSCILRSPIVSAEWLADHIQSTSVLVVDCRWTLSDPGAGIAAYRHGHLPGAVFADVATDLAAPTGPGRHPIPSSQEFFKTAKRLGITSDHTVIVYDDAGGSIAARLWWLLGYFGHPCSGVLDGGIQAWVADAGPLTRDVPAEHPHQSSPPFVPEPRTGWVVDRPFVVGLGPEALKVDARAPERYRGEVEPVDARAGHIPGAVNAPFAENLKNGTFRSPDELRQTYRALGVGTSEPAVMYCGSGVTACHNILATAIAGLPRPLLYEGSWSDWSRDASLPVAVGPMPDGGPGG